MFNILSFFINILFNKKIRLYRKDIDLLQLSIIKEEKLLCNNQFVYFDCMNRIMYKNVFSK